MTFAWDSSHLCLRYTFNLSEKRLRFSWDIPKTWIGFWIRCIRGKKSMSDWLSGWVKKLFPERLSPPKVWIGNRRLEQEIRTGWISYCITFQNYVIAISGCEQITPQDRVVVLNRDHHNFLHLYLISLKSLIRMSAKWIKEKGWEVNGQHVLNCFEGWKTILAREACSL